MVEVHGKRKHVANYNILIFRVIRMENRAGTEWGHRRKGARGFQPLMSPVKSELAEVLVTEW